MEKKYSINVKDLKKSIEFYSKFFSQNPKNLSSTSSEFILKEPLIHLILNENSDEMNYLDLKIEVSSSTKVKLWSNFLHAKGVEVSSIERIKYDTNEAVQFFLSDPDDYKWVIFSKN